MYIVCTQKKKKKNFPEMFVKFLILILVNCSLPSIKICQPSREKGALGYSFSEMRFFHQSNKDFDFNKTQLKTASNNNISFFWLISTFLRLIKILLHKVVQTTVILQIFDVVLFSVFSVVKGFTEIKKTPK